MYSPQNTRRSGWWNRRGLSFVEFVGCMLALGSGLAIGSVYLGVDMKTLFFDILERADLVDPGFFGHKAAANQVAAASPEKSTDAPTATPASSPADDDAIKLQASPNTDHGDVATAMEPGPELTEEPSDSEATGSESELTDQERQFATHAYWKGLTACMAEEVEHRRLGSSDPDNWQLFDYLTLRRDGHRKACEEIEQLDERGVDDRLLWHGRQVLSWNQAGMKLYGRAVDLLTDAPTDQLTGPFAQSWQSSATQHRMEEKLVREKHMSVASYLDHAYKDMAPFKPAF
jgi:hypothetical protein